MVYDGAYLASRRVITLSPLELRCGGRVILNHFKPKRPFKGTTVTMHGVHSDLIFTYRTFLIVPGRNTGECALMVA